MMEFRGIARKVKLIQEGVTVFKLEPAYKYYKYVHVAEIEEPMYYCRTKVRPYDLDKNVVGSTVLIELKECSTRNALSMLGYDIVGEK